MQQYLNDIKYAASQLIEAIWKELNKIDKLEKEITDLIKIAEEKYKTAESLEQSEDADDIMMGAGIKFEAYFGEDKEAFYKDKKLKNLELSFSTHKFAIASLCGSLLQFAKQGISIVHSGLNNCPNGRLIGTQNLKDTIWQGRNQAIHYEEGKFTKQVEIVFNTLELEIDSNFKNFKSENMAFEIVQLLGWKTFTDFENDMMLLA